MFDCCFISKNIPTHRRLPVEQAVLLDAGVTVRPPADAEVAPAQDLHPPIDGRGDGFA